MSYTNISFENSDWPVDYFTAVKLVRLLKELDTPLEN